MQSVYPKVWQTKWGRKEGERGGNAESGLDNAPLPGVPEWGKSHWLLERLRSLGITG